MLRVIVLCAALVSFVGAQQINFPPGAKGTRSLWVSTPGFLKACGTLGCD